MEKKRKKAFYVFLYWTCSSDYARGCIFDEPGEAVINKFIIAGIVVLVIFFSVIGTALYFTL
ncbi:hypothetical protein [Domibacillus iocasae]|uniref:Uncharacterized protein n=1 Tax=Domibacillus iocasae TaxID=1714016 RepID=A0A1E7DU93_9BACI|nr:hypothetical protein [Domibacillus iocasae]OES46653.1 hypothetical protein BA724_00930 [Domibacillus iocasae]